MVGGLQWSYCCSFGPRDGQRVEEGRRTAPWFPRWPFSGRHCTVCRRWFSRVGFAFCFGFRTAGSCDAFLVKNPSNLLETAETCVSFEKDSQRHYKNGVLAESNAQV